MGRYPGISRKAAGGAGSLEGRSPSAAAGAADAAQAARSGSIPQAFPDAKCGQLILEHRIPLKQLDRAGTLSVACPLCGRSRAARTLFRGNRPAVPNHREDVPGRECEGCGLIRAWTRRPTRRRIAALLSRRILVRAAQADAASRLEEMYRRLVLRDHVHFVLRAPRDSRASAARCSMLAAAAVCCCGLLQERGLRVAGTRNSPAAAAAAWQHHRVRVVCGDLAKAPVAPRKLRGRSPCFTSWSICPIRSRT